MDDPDPASELDAGSLALDLLNTAEPAASEGGDALASPDSLRAWLARRGLVGAPGVTERLRSPPVARTLLREARHLRGDVDKLVDAHRRGAPVPDHVVYALNRILASSCAARSLVLEPGGPRLVEREASSEPLAVLAPIARAAVVLLRDADATRVRRCAAAECGRWFLDTSKAGRRKWCSMSTCGNRAKAARHRRRTKRTASA